MSCGLRLPSLSASTPTTDQVEGMNCIGPTARSHFASESYWPASVSGMTAVLLLPSSAMPKMPGVGEALGVEGVAVGAAVVGLDPADRGDQLPGEVAGLVGGVDDGLGALVGGERGGGDAGGRGGGDDALGVCPRRPGATTPGAETLAGASIASVGTLVPSGSVAAGSSPRGRACSAPTPARLAVQAADSSASGTSAVAFCKRPNRGADIDGLSRRCSTGVLPQAPVVIQRTLSRAVTAARSSVTEVPRSAPPETTIPAGHDA